jgi:hypothetical protein
MLLLLTNFALASPTTENNNLLMPACLATSRTQTNAKIFQHADTRLITIGRQIMTPEIAYYGPVSSRYHPIESLPPVPAALLMSITGFVFVSLVKDRGLWLATLMAVLSAGQAGATAVPGFVRNLSAMSRPDRRKAVSVKCYLFENRNRRRDNIEGTGYIGLLNHLEAIPKSKNTSRFCRCYRLSDTRHNNLLKAREFTVTLPFHCSIFPIGPAAITGWFICFKPAFIFQISSRAPPVTSNRNNLSA